MINLQPGDMPTPDSFTFQDCAWLAKQGIDYRDFWLVQSLREQ